MKKTPIVYFVVGCFFSCAAPVTADSSHYSLGLHKTYPGAGVPSTDTSSHASEIERLGQLERQISLLEKRIEELEKFEKSATGVHLLTK